jgi:hypothetical protein
LSNHGYIIACGRKVFGITYIFATSGITDMEVGDMPVLDQGAKGTGGFEALKLP